MELQSFYLETKQALAKAPNADPGLEAFFLLEGSCGIRRGDLLAGRGEVSPEQADRVRQLVRRRLDGEPLQYLLGRWEFYGLPMEVGPGVLIPRPETELLVERALEAIREAPSPLLLDLCSGSGCIPIALGKSRPDAKIWGVERSAEALAYFTRNIARNQTANVAAVEGDVFHLPREITGRQYDVITANPPYIASGALSELQEEVRWEPAEALDGGADGLDFYRMLPGICLPLLKLGGLLLLEIGEDQGPPVKALLEAAGYRQAALAQDLSGLDRIVSGRRSM